MTKLEGQSFGTTRLIQLFSSLVRHSSFAICHSCNVHQRSTPELTWSERLYLPAIAAGMAITLRHFKNMLFRRTKVTMEYPEEKWDRSRLHIFAAPLP
jgi:hypothetical protein